MKAPINSAIETISNQGYQLSLDMFSIFKMVFVVVIAALVYHMMRGWMKLLLNTGVIGKTGVYYKFINAFVFIVPTLVFLFGLTNVSQNSLLVSLVFLITFSIVLGYSFVDSAKSLLVSLIIHLRGDLMVGDYLAFGQCEGEIVSMDAFQITLRSPQGVKIHIPTHIIFKNVYKIYPKRGGPSFSITIPLNKISQRDVERLAWLCPFRRENSDVKISLVGNSYQLSMEIISQDCLPQVNQYFERHWQ